jgi:steroid delta-isomerase-like uncharacterized protein
MTTSREQEEALVRRLYDAINRNDTAAQLEIFAPDMVRHDLTDLVEDSHGNRDVTSFLAGLRAAMPDLYLQLDDVLATGEGKAAARVTLTGTQTGDFLGAAPTGRKVTFAAISHYRIADGRIAEVWSLVDWAGALQQLTAD